MRGQSTVIVASVFLALVILAIIPLYAYLHTSSTRTATIRGGFARKLDLLVLESSNLEALFDVNVSVLQLINRGDHPIHVEEILTFVVCGSERMFINSKLGTTLVVGIGQMVNIPLPQLKSLGCENPDSMNMYIITSVGSVVKVTTITQKELTLLQYIDVTNPDVQQPFASGITILPIRVTPNESIHNISILLTKGFEIYTLDRHDRPTRLVPFSNLSRGMIGGTPTSSYVWRLDREFNNTRIVINSQSIRSVWVGFDPRNTSRYNILITCDSITVATPSVTTNTYTRIKIYGFEPSTPQGILRLGSTWITSPSQDVADYTFNNTRLTLNGTATRVEVYVRALSTSESSYNPYIMFMNNIATQNTSGLLFTTIDRHYGLWSTTNEEINALHDYSTLPLVLLYKYPISNAEYSAVIIAINYAFHDNEGSDANGTTVDLPIMIVGLADQYNNIYLYRSYTFRELTKYEDTYPPTAQLQSSIVLIPLPPSGSGERVFYVFIAIQDPYRQNGTYDDLDFTLYISTVTLIPVKR